jgi:hypothetical protein
VPAHDGVVHRLDDVVWIESAGGGLLVDDVGTWLAAMSPSELAYTNPERRALAGAHWDQRFGDRHVSMAVLVCGAQADEITSALYGALLTDDELSRPHEWSQYPDPFGEGHADPCQDLSCDVDDATTRGNHEPGEGR